MAARSEPQQKPLAVSMGDPAGIGPEIILKAWHERQTRHLAAFVVCGDPGVFEQRARQLGLSIPLAIVETIADAPALFHRALPIQSVVIAHPSQAGHPDSANGTSVIASIERAVAAVAHGEARALVTAPISKSVLYEAGFEYPGHTEFLAALAARFWPGRHCRPVMMLACEALRVVPLTIHVALKEVPRLVTRALIHETARITWEALRREFSIELPRIAVAGLNPHAGEGGSMGREDVEIILPAVRDLQQEGIAVTGPLSADTMFHEMARKSYDAAIAMYHDQALIPIKTLAFDEGVNVTLGLPFVRTSPDHGTAFSIAAEGRASPASFINALRLADEIATRRTNALGDCEP